MFGGSDGTAAAGRVQRGRERGEDRRQLARGTRVALEQGGGDVREGRCGRIAEADRLLDLERERDTIGLDPAVVLDRHEPQEAVELAGATGLLGRRERGGAEPLELPLDRSDCGFDVSSPSTPRPGPSPTAS